MDCQSCTPEVPRLDWLEVEMGDRISLSVAGVDRASLYEVGPLASEGFTPLLVIREKPQQVNGRSPVRANERRTE